MLDGRNSLIKVKGAYLIITRWWHTFCGQNGITLCFRVFENIMMCQNRVAIGPILAQFWHIITASSQCRGLYIPGGTLHANKKSLMSGMSSLYVMLGRGELPPGSTSSSPPEESLQPPESHLHHIDQPHEMGHGQHLNIKMEMDGVLFAVFEIYQPIERDTDSTLTLNARDRVISVKLCQYHGSWCPGSLRRQDISSHDIYFVEYVGSCLTWGRISTTCVVSMWRNDTKCN